MEAVAGNKLKKGLGQIKKQLTKNIGPVWKLPKKDVIDKIKSLKYSYDEKDNSLRASKKSAMKRMPTHIKL
tara:strand:- start:853 stop:1065 length:213 start_codon:yes stop_codon:yes gene_type:complete